ncbi:MAG: OmpH family outer membrane protein [Perlucidibaca sp.]
MNKQLMNVMFAGLLAVGANGLAQAAANATRVAVLDTQEALLDTDVAKAAKSRLQIELKPQYSKADQLRNEIKALDDKFQKEAATMSEKDKKALRAQQADKLNDFNGILQQAQKRSQDAEQDVLNKLLPSFKGIVEDLRKTGDYDLILDRRSVIYVSPDIDLTKKVTERLNAGK